MAPATSSEPYAASSPSGSSTSTSAAPSPAPMPSTQMTPATPTPSTPTYTYPAYYRQPAALARRRPLGRSALRASTPASSAPPACASRSSSIISGGTIARKPTITKPSSATDADARAPSRLRRSVRKPKPASRQAPRGAREQSLAGDGEQPLERPTRGERLGLRRSRDGPRLGGVPAARAGTAARARGTGSRRRRARRRRPTTSVSCGAAACCDGEPGRKTGLLGQRPAGDRPPRRRRAALKRAVLEAPRADQRERRQHRRAQTRSAPASAIAVEQARDRGGGRRECSTTRPAERDRAGQRRPATERAAHRKRLCSRPALAERARRRQPGRPPRDRPTLRDGQRADQHRESDSIQLENDAPAALPTGTRPAAIAPIIGAERERGRAPRRARRRCRSAATRAALDAPARSA